MQFDNRTATIYLRRIFSC